MMATTPIRCAGLVATTALAVGLLTTCTVAPPPQQATPAHTREARPGPTSSLAAPPASAGVVGDSPALNDRAAAARPSAASSSPVTWPTPAAESGAIAAARAWASAANSSSYRDPAPGSWTLRTRPYVTGPEARVEAELRTARGGNTWARIQTEQCVTRLRDLVASVPSDTPSGPRLRIVYVSATVALSCADGAVDLSDFTAQLTVQQQTGRWLVTAVRH